MKDVNKMTDEELMQGLSRAWLAGPPGHSWPTLAAYVRSIVPPAPEPAARVPVGIADIQGGRTVVCSDGTVWSLRDDAEAWLELPPIPQPQPAPTKFGFPPANTCLTPAQAAAQERDRLDAVVAVTMEAAAPVADPLRDAAPKLLAALKMWIEAGDRSGWPPNHRIVEHHALVAKAEGRT